MDPYASVWPLELEIWTPTLPWVGDVDFHALVWPLQLGIWTPTLRFGPST